MDEQLPPMPPSDLGSLERNHYDSFYKISSRSFWKDNEVIRIKDEPIKKCHHKFEMIPTGVKCSKCHFGLIGPLKVRDGRLFYKGNQIVF